MTKRYVPKWQLQASLITLALVTIAALFRIGVLAFHPILISPLPNTGTMIQVKEMVTVAPENPDTWIDRYARMYSEDNAEYIKFQLHCLYWKESRNGQSNDMGDGGKAGGPYQFHQATWVRMRDQMIDKGLITEIGNRFDPKQAIQTTAWALANGRELEWGPVKRGECK